MNPDSVVVYAFCRSKIQQQQQEEAQQKQSDQQSVQQIHPLCLLSMDTVLLFAEDDEAVHPQLSE